MGVTPGCHRKSAGRTNTASRELIGLIRCQGGGFFDGLPQKQFRRRSKMPALPGYATTYEIVKPGAGPAVSKGNTVTVHATGVVKQTGKKFWCVPVLCQFEVNAARCAVTRDLRSARWLCALLGARSFVPGPDVLGFCMSCAQLGRPRTLDNSRSSTRPVWAASSLDGIRSLRADAVIIPRDSSSIMPWRARV